MSRTTDVVLRDSRDTDLPVITATYGHWVTHGLASFELTPPDEAEMQRRRADVKAAGFPYIVAVGLDGSVLGHAYAYWYRTRPAYRFTCEDSVYIAPSAIARGIGRLLLKELIERCSSAGFRQMVAVIGDSGNAASIQLHRKAGFLSAGLLPAVGWKHDRWVDSVLMTRALGDGSATAPADQAPQELE